MSFATFIEREFPVPEFLQDRAAGIDISDASVKWIVLEPSDTFLRVASYGTLPIPSDMIAAGVIKDVEGLGRVLSEVRQRLGSAKTVRAHVALPEEPAFVFGMRVPRNVSHEEVLRLIEFEFEGRVPISPKAAVYDFDVISRAGGDSELNEISVEVFPKDLVQAYADACFMSAITPLSFEVEARSVGRTIFQARDTGVTLLVDFGRKRSGFAVLKRGLPIFTSTVDLGGDVMTAMLQRTLSLSETEAEEFKNARGLRMAAEQGKPDDTSDKKRSEENKQGFESIISTASALADEVVRHYYFWDSQRSEKGERVTPVERIVFVGGNANLKGLTEYIAHRVHAPVECAQVWRNVASFDEYIPPIERQNALVYATAIGLALRGTRGSHASLASL